MLSKAAEDKSKLEAEVTKSRCELANLQDALHEMKVASDGLSQDKIDLNKVIMQVRHFLSLFTSYYSVMCCQHYCIYTVYTD